MGVTAATPVPSAQAEKWPLAAGSGGNLPGWPVAADLSFARWEREEGQ